MEKNYKIDDNQSLSDYLESLTKGELHLIKQIGNVVTGVFQGERCTFEIDSKYKSFIPAQINNVINGKDNTERIVNISHKNNIIYIYRRIDGVIKLTTTPARMFALSHGPVNSSFTKLKGPGHYNHIKYYSPSEFEKVKNRLYRGDFYFNTNPVESFLTASGFTYFKGMQPQEVSILSFDLETTTVDPEHPNAKILCIGNTYRVSDLTIKKVFREDKFDSQKEMIEAWCDWVKRCNPDIMTGYNIYLFDIPYLLAMSKKHEVELSLGRDDSALRFEKRTKPRKIRKDGSQEYDYRRPELFGRDIIDMWIVTLKADQAAKKYDNYALKHVIRAEGLQKEGRVLYDASKIAIDWLDTAKRKDIVQYCEDDSEDPIKLYDIMITSFFLLTAYIPKPFQIVTETNTGGQINSLLVRSYLQEGWSIPKGEETSEFRGAISWGNPGLYKNVVKFDVASLYPSIMRHYEIHPKTDYLGNFLKMLEYFTLSRLENKKLAKETGMRYYHDKEQTEKIFINSSYGALTTPGLNFNDMIAGSSVTRYGREVLEKSIIWATGRSFDEWEKAKEEEDAEIQD